MEQDDYTNIPLNSPFRYPGGKFYARKLILEYVPKHGCYIEPMCGGASIFFAKQKSEKNILNDIDPELINCLVQIRDNAKEIADYLEGQPASKEKHDYFKNKFKQNNELERAARWFYLNRTSYSGIMKFENCYFGYGDKYSMRPENWRRHLIKTAQKLEGVELFNLDFETIINNAPDNAFLFIDPPYFNRDQDKFYSCSFSKKDHERLTSALKTNSNRLKFLLTYDDESEIREMYSWANINSKEWNYMIYRTDDQTKEKNGNGKKHNGKRYQGQELFIFNYKKPKIIKQTILGKD